METLGKLRVQVEAMAAMTYVNDKLTVTEERIKRHFDVFAENIAHDLRGALNDKFAQHEDRILRLEQHVQLA